MAAKKKSAREDDLERYGFPLTLRVARDQIAKWEGLSEAQDKTIRAMTKAHRRLKRELRRVKRERQRAARDGWDRALNTLLKHLYDTFNNQCACGWIPDSASSGYLGQWVEHLRGLFGLAPVGAGKTLDRVG